MTDSTSSSPPAVIHRAPSRRRERGRMVARAFEIILWILAVPAGTAAVIFTWFGRGSSLGQ